MDNNYHRTKALLNILIEKGITTQEEFDNEIKKSKRSERDAMFIKKESVSLCSSCKVESQYPSCGAIESDYKFKLGIGVLKCDLYEKR